MRRHQPNSLRRDKFHWKAVPLAGYVSGIGRQLRVTWHYVNRTGVSYLPSSDESESLSSDTTRYISFLIETSGYLLANSRILKSTHRRRMFANSIRLLFNFSPRHFNLKSSTFDPKDLRVIVSGKADFDMIIVRVEAEKNLESINSE